MPKLFKIKPLLKYLKSKKSSQINSRKYWESRYSSGGNSGAGSYGKFAVHKSKILNEFVEKNNITKVIEFGCGDGNQLQLANYPEYLGLDVSMTALELCRNKFNHDKSKAFKILKEYQQETADLVLSLDVIFHLVEDKIYIDYMKTLCSATNKYLIIYSSNQEEQEKNNNAVHVKHRKFSSWIENHFPQLDLIEVIPNIYPYHGDHLEGSFADFYIYKLRS